jgi:LacI family repressor for deo operon, udp, cdd, tsx, nupC, and nupG
VLNNSSLVRESTRLAVEKAVSSLNYAPSWIARDLRQDRTGRVLILFPRVHSPVLAEVFSGIDEVARENRYFPLICPTAKDGVRERELLGLVSSRIVDGVIFIGTTLSASELDQLAENQSVIQCLERAEGARTPCVSIDDFEAAQELTAHLVSLGHRSIGMVTNRSEPSSRLREEGFRAYLNSASIAVDESLILDGTYDFSTGRESIRRLVAGPRRPTALVCASDVVAAGAITEARNVGLEIPGDIAIAGFDDSPEAQMTLPQITTIRQPFVEIGRQTMKSLLNQIGENVSSDGQGETVAHELIVRGSTASSSS